MIDIQKKMIKEVEKLMDHYIMEKTWKVAIYNKHGTLMGKSNPFKFIKKRLVWSVPQLIILIKKTGFIASAFMVSGRDRWDITKNARWDALFQNYGAEIIVDDLMVSMGRFYA